MDRDHRLWLDDPAFRKAWSLSTGGLAEAAAQVLFMFIALGVVVGFQITDGVAIIALSVVLALPAYAVARARSNPFPSAIWKGFTAAGLNLCAAAMGYAVLALPNFFFA